MAKHHQNRYDDDEKMEMGSKDSGGRCASSLGGSFSIETDDDSNDADSSSYSGSEAAMVQHPSTLKAYEMELRRAFAFVANVEQHRRASLSTTKVIKAATKEADATTKNISRRTSADWYEMIQKKEEEKQRKIDAKAAERTVVDASLCDDSVEIEEIDMDDSQASIEIDVEDVVEDEIESEEEGEGMKERMSEGDSDGESDAKAQVPDTNTQENEEKAAQKQQQQQRELTKSQKRRIMAISILTVFGLVLILGLVIGLTGQGHNTSTSQNLRGENGASSSTSKPAPAAIPSKQPTSRVDDTISILTPMDTAVEGAASISNTGGTWFGTTSSNQPAQSNSTATTVETVSSPSSTTPPTSNKPAQAASTAIMVESVSVEPLPATTSNQPAQSNSATIMVAAVSDQSATTVSSQPAQSNSSTLICDAVKPVGDQCNSALQLLEKCTSSGTASHSRYGTSTAINVNGEDVLAVVGATADNHATLLSYDKSGRTWNHVSDLNTPHSSSSSISSAQLGSAVAMSSEWIAISTPVDMTSTSVTLYRVSNAIQNVYNAAPGLSIEQADKTLGSQFGSSLAIDDDVLVVGAMRDRDNKGSVYIYQYDNGWSQVSKLQSDNISSHAQGNFGHSVAISQNIIVVGAPNDTVNGKQQCGSVYIFQLQDSARRIAYIQKLSPPELSAGDQFGYVVTVDVSINPITNMREDRIAIGTNMDDDQGTNSGSVFVYLRRVGERLFSLEQKLLPSDFSPKSAFGSSIDMQGHRMIVGSKGYGVASLFEYKGESWVEMGSSKDIESGRALGDNFGSSVSIASWEENNNGAGGVVLVGAPLNDEAGEDSGRIYSYAICDTSLDQDQAEMLFT